jgi:UDPglucose 6-dehydrogenase
MRVTVIGAGYVGLVTAACLAELGHHVTNVDIDAGKIARLARGESPIYEPGLEPILERNTQGGRLRFTDDVGSALESPEVIFIAVGTPANGHGFADLGYVMSAARTIGERLQRRAVVVVKSTVPPGTCARIERAISTALASRGMGRAVAVVSNPEFLREGCAVEDCLHPDRIVIGTDDPAAAGVMHQLYAALTRRGSPLLELDTVSSELTKYAANAMLAARVSLVNEIASIAEAFGADILQVCRGLAADHRIGPHFLNAGVGYGGSCFPKDMRALARVAFEAGIEAPMIAATEQVNEAQKRLLARRVLDWMTAHGGVSGRTVALWGLAFKPGTDDMREAPSLTIVSELLAAGATVRAHDPVAGETARRLFQPHPRLSIVDSAEDALAGAALLVLVTEWDEYRAVPPTVLADALSERMVFDGRNTLDAQALVRAGVQVAGIGRSTLPLPAGEPAAAAPQLTVIG